MCNALHLFLGNTPVLLFSFFYESNDAPCEVDRAAYHQKPAKGLFCVCGIALGGEITPQENPACSRKNNCAEICGRDFLPFAVMRICT